MAGRGGTVFQGPEVMFVKTVEPVVELGTWDAKVPDGQGSVALSFGMVKNEPFQA